MKKKLKNCDMFESGRAQCTGWLPRYRGLQHSTEATLMSSKDRSSACRARIAPFTSALMGIGCSSNCFASCSVFQLQVIWQTPSQAITAGFRLVQRHLDLEDATCPAWKLCRAPFGVSAKIEESCCTNLLFETGRRGTGSANPMNPPAGRWWRARDAPQFLGTYNSMQI